MDSLQWWMNRLDTLMGTQKKAAMSLAKTNRAYDAGSWALLKHAILAYYVDIFTNITKAIFDKAFYLDAFAGPGLNTIRGTDEVIFGSPLIAEFLPRAGKRFDRLILIEKDQESALSLKTLLPKAEVIQADVNDQGITQALDILKKSGDYPCLAFIDPEGLDLNWQTLEKVLRIWSDAIINYQPDAVRRAVGSANSLKKTENTRQTFRNKLTRFFGTTEWENCVGEQDLFELYLSQIQNCKEKIIPIKVAKSGSFYYYIIVAVKKTGGHQGWINVIHETKKKIEKTSSREARKFIEIYRGRQKTILDHI